MIELWLVALWLSGAAMGYVVRSMVQVWREARYVRIYQARHPSDVPGGVLVVPQEIRAADLDTLRRRWDHVDGSVSVDVVRQIDRIEERRL